MTIKKRNAKVPTAFYLGTVKCSKADLLEILWDVMCQSPWFDETSACENPGVVAERVMEIRKALKEVLWVDE